MSKKITASILGVTGYTGVELLRLLLNHPQVELKHLISQSHAGKKISEVWPHLQNVCDAVLSNVDLEKVAAESDVIFLALPHYETQKIVPHIIGKTKIIDLAGDFRLKSLAMYKKYYQFDHAYSAGFSQFVYGLPEYNKNEVTQAHNIANPGCFAITSQLALLPLKGLISQVFISAITGSSASGKNPKEETHHPVRNHNVKSYKIGTHQHIPEIIQTLGITENQITLVPTSGPYTRGIHLTAFVELKKSLEVQEIDDLYKNTYKDAQFIRLKKSIQLADVIGSNFCDISVNIIDGKIIIQGVIDTLVKGAGGTAIQNMNCMFGLAEETGLQTLSPLFP